MEESRQSGESAPRSIADLDFPVGGGPRPHRNRLFDPRVVEAHFAPLAKHRPTPEQRWASKAGGKSFPGL